MIITTLTKIEWNLKYINKKYIYKLFGIYYSHIFLKKKFLEENLLKCFLLFLYKINKNHQLLCGIKPSIFLIDRSFFKEKKIVEERKKEETNI